MVQQQNSSQPNLRANPIRITPTPASSSAEMAKNGRRLRVAVYIVLFICSVTAITLIPTACLGGGLSYGKFLSVAKSGLGPMQGFLMV